MHENQYVSVQITGLVSNNLGVLTMAETNQGSRGSSLV